MNATRGRFERQVAVVTGAASGIGRAIADRLLAEGARVLAVDVDEDGLGWAGRVDDAEAFVGSVTDRDTATGMVERAVKLWGRLDVAALNAGITPPGSILDPGDEVFDACVEVNLRGVAHGVRAALPVMLQRGGGAIVVTSSTAGLGGDAGAWAYNATKAATVNLVRSAAVEIAHRGVRVNAVCPGPVFTEAAQRFEQAAPELIEVFRTRTPMRRWARPEEVAAVVAFLASADASYVTGVALPVDGGVTAMSGLFPLPEETV